MAISMPVQKRLLLYRCGHDDHCDTNEEVQSHKDVEILLLNRCLSSVGMPLNFYTLYTIRRQVYIHVIEKTRNIGGN